MNNGDKTLEDVLTIKLPELFEWLKRINRLDRLQTIQMATYHLNYYILLHYFPTLTDEFIPHEIEGGEIINGILAKSILQYKGSHLLSKSETTQEIRKLYDYYPLLLTVFASLTSPVALKLKDLEKIYKNMIYLNPFLPNLIFDEEYESLIIKSKAFRHMFTVSQDKNVANQIRSLEFRPLEYDEFSAETFCRLVDEKPYSFLPKFTQVNLNGYGYVMLGIAQLIEDITMNLSKYYMKRIPKNASEIQETIAFFREILKLVEGKLYYEISRAKLLSYLEKTFSKKKASELLNKFSRDKQFHEFDTSYKNFNKNSFLQEYYELIRYPLFFYSGIYRTGAFLIWRGLLKYLERIQDDEEFKELKGTLLELWAHKKAKEYGFEAHKVILTNLSKEPSPIYKIMMEKAQEFPDVIEISLIALKGSKAGFYEIDLAINIANYLFLVECKGTAISHGAYPLYVQWRKKLEKQYELLKKKGRYLKSIITDVDHPLFHNIKEIVSIILKTEGIYTDKGVMDPYGFDLFLKQCRENIDNNTFEQFFRQYYY